MTVWNCSKPTKSPPRPIWDAIPETWHGEKLLQPARFLFWLDPDALYFACAHLGRATIHPEAEAGKFQAELWKYDVGEYFLAAPDGSYLEVNLAPNGGWWLCHFSETLKASEKKFPQAGVVTHAHGDNGFWQAQIAVPRRHIEAIFPAWDELSLNANFILQTPDQIFLSAATLKSDHPDFHLPKQFPKIALTDLPES